jgi:hypothetical protein
MCALDAVNARNTADSTDGVRRVPSAAEQRLRRALPAMLAPNASLSEGRKTGTPLSDGFLPLIIAENREFVNGFGELLWFWKERKKLRTS